MLLTGNMSDPSDAFRRDKIIVNDIDERDLKNYGDHHQKEAPRAGGLFRKYLFLKAQHNNNKKMEKKNEECCRVIKRTTSTSCDWKMPDIALTSRTCSSILEKHIFSVMK